MSDRGTANQDLFQIWLASSRTFFAAEPTTGPPMTDALKERCEGLSDGHRTADLVAAGEGAPITGCRAMGDLVVAKLEAR